VVVVDVLDDNVDDCEYAQRFFRARPTAVPVFNATNTPYTPSTPTSTPKANDSRNRIHVPPRDASSGAPDWTDSPSSKTWTSRERIKTATCVALSPEGRFLAVGETGYAPRVLIFSLEDQSSDRPLVCISEHTIGVNAVAWSPDSRFLASLGAATDGFLYLWRIDPWTGVAKLFQQNRCTSFVRGMIWMGPNLVTLGVRHVKVWRANDPQSASPVKITRSTGEPSSPLEPSKSLPGRNVLLGDLLEATFSCAAALDEARAIICSETGDLCLLDDTEKQMVLTKVLEIGFVTTCVAIRGHLIYVGSKNGNSAALNTEKFMASDPDCIEYATDQAGVGYVAFGFLKNSLVTVDMKHSVGIGSIPFKSGIDQQAIARAQLPGPGSAILGLEVLSQPNIFGASFFTWSGSGDCVLWDMDGQVKTRCRMYVEEAHIESECDPSNLLTAVKSTHRGSYFITGDKLGMVRVADMSKPEYPRVANFKAHSSNCQFINVYEDDSNFFFASCGRDRTVQLYQRTTVGEFVHFQTIDFPSKVVQILIPSSDRVITSSLDRTIQVFDLGKKPEDADAHGALSIKSISLKSSPTSMIVTPNRRNLYVSMLDKSVCLYEFETGKLVNTFKCMDETGQESVVLDSLIYRPATENDPAYLLGLSNTDKSIRLYDARTGNFVDREWGHSEAIQGLAIVDDAEVDREVVSVGSDGTMMFWGLGPQDQGRSSASRDASPMKDPHTPARPPLRRVLSRAELAEFQRSTPTGSASGRRSPPRRLGKQRSLYNLKSGAASSKTIAQSSPSPAVAENRFLRRPSTGSRDESPPASPQPRAMSRRPSLPALNSRKSASNLKSFNSLNIVTEQTSRTLRAFRKKLTASTQPVNPDALTELDQELRLTSLALGDKAKQSKAINDVILTGVLDQYSARLIEMLEERLNLSERTPTKRRSSRSRGKRDRSRDENTDREADRPCSSDAGSTTTSGS
jgi:WD40 repeat protein